MATTRLLKPSTVVDLSRDEMRQMIDAGLGATPPAASWAAKAKRQQPTPKRVVVVGAGMAGLVAASQLKTAGHDVTLLEANTVVGGRVKTMREPFTAGLYCEVGAMRIPRSHKNVNAYIDKFGLKTNPFVLSMDQNYVCANGVKVRLKDYLAKPDILKYPLDASEKGKTADALWSLVTKDIVDFIAKDPAKHWPVVVQKYDHYSVRTFLKHHEYAPGKTLSEGAVEMIGVLLDEEEIMMTSFIESIRDQTEINPGIEYLEIVGGNDQLPKAFLPQIGPNIIYNAWVTAVTQTDHEVIVQYENPSILKRFEVRAEAAIITVPYSALRMVEFASGCISHDKLRAMRQLHYDTSTKILLEFRSRFWEKEGIQGGSTVSDLPIRFTHYPSHGIGESGPAVLLASYTWGDDSLRWDSLSEEDRIKHALEQVAQVHGPHVFDEFTVGASHSWIRNEYTCGAFALFAPEQQSSIYPYIAMPERRIHFAGEHTTLMHAWIEGAIESGLRVAKEVNEMAY